MSESVCSDELEKELILMEQELIFKRKLLNECREKLNSEISEHAKTKSALNKYLNENKELQIQLGICLTGTQKLEEENKKIREDLVKLQIQINAYLTERQQTLDNSYQAEKENNALKNEVMELKEQLNRHLMFIDSFKKRHSKTQALVKGIMEKQEILNKEQLQLEKTCKESLQFTEKLSEEANFYIKYVRQAKISQAETESQIIRLMAAVTELKAGVEKNKNGQHQPENLKYLEIRESRQRELEIRNGELQETNQRLLEELTLAKEQIELLMQNH